MNNDLKKIVKKIPILYPCWHRCRIMINVKKEKNKIKAYKKYSCQILKEVFAVVVEDNIKCVCMAGTLLGLIRDGCLIPWDDDLDFVIVNDASFSWKAFEESMGRKGFWKCRTFEKEGMIVSQSYKKRGVSCDFGLWPDSKDVIEVVYSRSEIPTIEYKNGCIAKYREWNQKIPGIKGIVKKEIGETVVLIPQNSEEILGAIYGKTWRIPDQNFSAMAEETVKEYRVTYYKKPFRNK